jgi:hypothetical protein
MECFVTKMELLVILRYAVHMEELQQVVKYLLGGLGVLVILQLV